VLSACLGVIKAVAVTSAVGFEVGEGEAETEAVAFAVALELDLSAFGFEFLVDGAAATGVSI